MGTHKTQFAAGKDYRNIQKDVKEFTTNSDVENSESDYSDDFNAYQNESESGESETEMLDSKKAELKAELSKLTFEQILEIKQKIGIKEFDKIFKPETSEKNRNDKKPLDQVNDFRNKANSKNKQNTSRADTGKKKSKKEPTVLSSKKRTPRFWQVIEPTKTKSLDPRFEKSSGHLNLDLFKKSYSFLDNYQESEIQELKKTIDKKKKKKNEDTSELERLLKQMTSRKTAMENQSKLDAIKKEHKKREYDLIKQGKKPFFLKRSSLKEIELAKKFEQISGTKKLDKILEKKRKRNAAKEHKQMPFKRRSNPEE